MSRTLKKLYIRLLTEGYKVLEFRILSEEHGILRVVVRRPGSWDLPVEMNVFNNINERQTR